ncbi:MAG TPA: hypothetical protein VL096_07785 [Pirellulaceae bacterium]|nr:hypothetical protein [Pirellulaceae bacterium]
MNDKPPLPPLSDSPWFWVYTFGTFALILLVLIGPKFDERRAQQERQFQGRSRALQQRLGEEPTVELSTPGRTLLSLRPLYVVLGLMIAAGWTILWWQRWRTRPAVANLSEPSPPVPSEKARP